MRIITLRLLLLLLLSMDAAAQSGKVHTLPEVVFIPPSTDKYVWERVLMDRSRTLFGNSIACTIGEIYSFGGFNTLIVQREMNRIEGKKLVRDSIAYPGHGFMNNLFFIRDSNMYIGGGFDSGAGHYTYQDFWRYDLHTLRWARLQDLPFYYHHPLNVFAEDGRIIVLVPRLSGEQLLNATPVFYEYLPDSDTWKAISRELPVTQLAHTTINRSSLGLYPVAFKVGDDVFTFFQVWETGVNSFYKFNLKEAEWTELPPFPGTTKNLISAFAVSDGIYGYIGGGLGKKRVDNSKEVFRYDPELQKWEQIKDLPLGVRYAKGWRFKGETYVGFGINDKDLTVAVWKLRHKK